MHLLAPITKEEVYQALLSMKSYKAPGPNGFQPIFFKMYWEDVGDMVWSFVAKAFSTGNFLASVSNTLLVLIPKGESQRTFKDFRPISLCNVIYKLVSKVLVSRLRPYLDSIIHSWQNSFIPGRSTKDNAIVLQEVVHHMHKSKSKTGDPLSPYLFVLCMERLGIMIQQEVEEGTWKPIQLTRHGPKLSHIFFADDVLLFAKAEKEQAITINRVLESFCHMSGLKISIQKSRALASKGVTSQRKEAITTVTQIRITSRIENYLGFPMFQGRIHRRDFMALIERVNSKLTGWKSALLNKAGRVTLANAVLTALPSPPFLFKTQVELVLVCATLHNFLRKE
uniref:Retrovirus-related Pol polyprotein LINE-1 n=1 Tax=Cajanus cajan TaxID=3821 RepID=A0A151REQ2_CAJCA|nr:Retrovirus-related Pol polyprotein LINE-1 [Cajanus cajan]